jgi:hypothetical protein
MACLLRRIGLTLPSSGRLARRFASVKPPKSLSRMLVIRHRRLDSNRSVNMKVNDRASIDSELAVDETPK